MSSPDTLWAVAGGNPGGNSKGKANLRPAPAWQPGQSGNPSGRPKGAPGFRARCRTIAELGIEQMEALMKTGQLQPLELVAFVKELADRGGYLPVDRLAQAQSTWTKLALAALESQGVGAEERKKIMGELQATTDEALGNEQESVEGDDATGD